MKQKSYALFLFLFFLFLFLLSILTIQSLILSTRLEIRSYMGRLRVIVQDRGIEASPRGLSTEAFIPLL